MNLDSKLKKIREKMGFTQVQIAGKASITERGYQRYEAGERVPDAHTAQLIARALGSTVEELFPIPERQFGDIEEKPDGNRAK